MYHHTLTTHSKFQLFILCRLYLDDYHTTSLPLTLDPCNVSHCRWIVNGLILILCHLGWSNEDRKVIPPTDRPAMEKSTPGLLMWILTSMLHLYTLLLMLFRLASNLTLVYDGLCWLLWAILGTHPTFAFFNFSIGKCLLSSK